jgi:hypothetical protein
MLVNEIQKRNFERSFETRLAAHSKRGEEIVHQLLTVNGFHVVLRSTASITMESADGLCGIRIGLADDAVMYYTPDAQKPIVGNHRGFDTKFLNNEG